MSAHRLAAAGLRNSAAMKCRKRGAHCGVRAQAAEILQQLQVMSVEEGPARPTSRSSGPPYKQPALRLRRSGASVPSQLQSHQARLPPVDRMLQRPAELNLSHFRFQGVPALIDSDQVVTVPPSVVCSCTWGRELALKLESSD